MTPHDTYEFSFCLFVFQTSRGNISPLKVQCFPFYSILLALGVDHVDYFSLDVEFSELEVLKTVPFGAITIDTFTIEFRIFNETGYDVEGSKKKLEDIKTLFHNTQLYDYKGVLPPKRNSPDYTGLDAVFVRKNILSGS